MELTNRLKETWGEPNTQAYTQLNLVRKQSKALLNPIKSERENALLRLSPDVLLKIMTHYLNLSETTLLMLSCRHVLHLVNNDYPWKALYQAQLRAKQYLYDPHSHLIQSVAQNRIQQGFAYKQLYRFLAQGCVPWKVKAIAGDSWKAKATGDSRFELGYDPSDRTCKQIEILPNGNIAMIDVLGKASIWTVKCKRIATLYVPMVTSIVPLAGGGLVTLNKGPSAFDNTVRIWSAKGEQILAWFTDPISYIGGLPNGNFIIVPGNRIIICSPIGEAIADFKNPSDFPITCGIVLPNENIVMGSRDKVIIWSCKDNRLGVVPLNIIPMVCLVALLNGNILVGYANKAVIYSPSGIGLHECVVPNEDYRVHLRNIIVLANGNFVIVDLNAVYIWSLDGHFLVVVKDCVHCSDSITALPDGGFATLSAGLAKIWSPIGMQVATLRHKNSIRHMKVFSNGDLLTASSDGSIRIWTVDAEALIRIQNFDKYGCCSMCSVS